MIILEKISKNYDKINAVDSISLEVAEKDIAVILGPSGSGKTTLLRLIAGLEIPDNGKIFLGNQLCSQKGWVLTPHKREVGFVFQTPALWPHMTLKQNILFGLNGLSPDAAYSRLNPILEQSSLLELKDRYPDQVSGGEARRAAIARALITHSKYMLMDEPLINLDFKMKQSMMSLILKIVKEAGSSLIYVTHDLKEAKQINGKVWFMQKGKIRPVHNLDQITNGEIDGICEE
jgi:ABC-type Fe3+/spermidine/putrescine transport system ATPase subunit